MIESATDPRPGSFVQQLGVSPVAGGVLRVLVRDPHRSFTVDELAAWIGASNPETARSTALLANAGLAWTFGLDWQVRVLVSPLPLRQHLAR
jgi:hypothetical protein